jgi:hypothetical protein
MADPLDRTHGWIGLARGVWQSPSSLQVLTLELGGDVTLNLVQIPAGDFLMGSPASEPGRDANEVQHVVRITRPFYLGAHEVTQEQYELVMGSNPSAFREAKNPVEQVSWHEAQEFCRKLSEKTGRTVRLPTEAEWEYASRAGTAGPLLKRACGLLANRRAMGSGFLRRAGLGGFLAVQVLLNGSMNQLCAGPPDCGGFGIQPVQQGLIQSHSDLLFARSLQHDSQYTREMHCDQEVLRFDMQWDTMHTTTAALPRAGRASREYFTRSRP